MPKVLSVHSGDRKGSGKPAVLFGELVLDFGLRGDRHAGRDPVRQVSLFSEEVRLGLVAKGFAVPAEALSANILTLDLPLDALPTGTLLRLGEAELELTEKRVPCRSITRIDHHLPKLLMGCCGQLARVTKGGLVRPGDAIEVITPAWLSD